MLLSARLLTDVASVNRYNYPAEGCVEFNEGDAPTIYFQLVDLSAHPDGRPRGRRYMPAAGATLSVTMLSIDDGSTVVVSASQPYANDTSIWAFSLTSVQTIPGTRAMKLALTESAVVTNGYVPQALVINPMSPEF